MINALTKWMPGWKRKGWKKADGKEVLNKDLLASLDEALSGRTVEFEWVKGHNNHELNEAADDRARAAATAFQKGTAVPEGPGFVPAGTSAAPAEDEPAEEPTEPSLHEDVLTEPSTAAAGSATTVVSCRVPSTVADELVARAQSRGIHPQEFLAELIGRSLETE